ncbi:hypothetical protein ABK040_005386 [Willaertia magna]
MGSTNIFVDSLQTELDNLIMEYGIAYNSFRKEGVVGEKQLRLINITILGLYGALAVLLPTLIRVLLGGFIYEEEASRIANEFVMMSGALSLVLALLLHCSKRWDSGATKDLRNVVSFGYFLIAIITAISYYFGGNFIMFLVALLCGTIGYVSAKQNNLVQ